MEIIYDAKQKWNESWDCFCYFNSSIDYIFLQIRDLRQAFQDTKIFSVGILDHCL